MRIEYGTSRIAIIGEHSTIKLPRVEKAWLTKQIIRYYVENPAFALRLGSVIQRVRGKIGFAFRGASASATEGKFSKELSPLVVPTRSHGRGMIAVQKTTPDIGLELRPIWEIIQQETRVNLEDVRFHTFDTPNNFGLFDGEEVRVRDFGETRFIPFCIEHRKELRRAFARLTEIALDRRK